MKKKNLLKKQRRKAERFKKKTKLLAKLQGVGPIISRKIRKGRSADV